MSLFIGCVLLLILGYFTYGVFVEKVFGIQPSRPTPAKTHYDGIDYVAMPTWKVFAIQLLDIAGLGPIVGPILGALYGPQALLWIVFGSIFAGGVHDYLCGMLSVRSNGASIPEVVGDFLGQPARIVMRIISVILLLLVGVVFVVGPSALIKQMTGGSLIVITICVFLYYFASTVLPIDKIIGWLCPIFAALLIFSSVGIIGGLIYHNFTIIPNTDFTINTHPGSLPIWPLLFITLSCGALSGFHSTQSPLMARCIKNEKRGRLVFYGAMIAEGVIALIWATLGLSFYESPQMLHSILSEETYSGFLHFSSTHLLGYWGGLIALAGAVALPITSGDTAFRSARLIIAESFKMNQKPWWSRLVIAIPLFALAIITMQLEWKSVWQYFGLSNQALATVVLWAGAIYLAKNNRCHWIAALPAIFMTCVIFTYLAYEKHPVGFNLGQTKATWVGVIISAIIWVIYMKKVKAWSKDTSIEVNTTSTPTPVNTK